MKSLHSQMICGNQKRFILLFLAAAFSFAAYFFLPSSCPEPARRASVIFILAAFLWAFEIIPLHATAIAVVLASIFLLAWPGDVLEMDNNGYQIFLAPFANPIIMLFFGGFVLAAALHKHHIDEWLVQKLIRIFGTKPFWLLMGFVMTTGFVSMWISNTATTAMMITMISPILADNRNDAKFKTALALAVAFSANVGGIATPVGTPPNAIALGILSDKGIHISFLKWMMMAFPLAVFLLAATSVTLFWMFGRNQKNVFIPEMQGAEINLKSKSTAAIGLLTIILWLTSTWHRIPESVVALLAVGLLTSFRLIDHDDLKGIGWDILILMWGGLAIGRAIEVSGLGKWLVSMPVFSAEGYTLVIAFSLLTVFLSIVMSNTATAGLVIPIAMSVSAANPIVLAVVIALSGSFDMILPVSTPPNAMIFSTKAVRSVDMLKAGTAVSVIALILLLAGYPFFIERFLS